MLKKLTALALTLMFVLSVCSGAFNAIAYAVEGNEREIAEKLHLTQVQDFNGRDDVTIMVELDGDTALEKAGSDVKSSTVYTEQLLKNQASAKKSIEKVLKQEVVVKNNYTLLFNGFSFEGTVDMVAEINALPGVTAFVAPEYALPKTVASTELVNAVDLWELGYTGKGTTVAILDTGITADHEAFSVNPPAA
ncbi:MAG: hypothetical protein IJO93_04065, partial [Clostridia bacterium]|nr:hypothetical protein [Clostridia bacterium]